MRDTDFCDFILIQEFNGRLFGQSRCFACFISFDIRLYLW